MKKYALFLAVIIAAALLSSCYKNTTKKIASSSVASKVSSSETDSSASSVGNVVSSSVPAASSAHESPDPNVKALYTNAIANYVEKNYTQAVEYSEKALALDPQCYEALNIKGIATYYSTGNPQDGLPWIDKSLQINPNYQYAYFCEAMIHKGMKDWDTSISLFQKSIALKPDDAWSYYGISTIYADRDMVSESLDYLKKAIEKDPSVKDTAKVQDHFIKMRSNSEFQEITK